MMRPAQVRIRCGAAALMLCCAVRAEAQQPPSDPHAAQPERPTVATHAGTVAPGWAELETGGEWDRYADSTHGVSAPVLLKIGLAPRVQLSLQGFGIWAPGGTGRGPGDFSAGIKWRLVEDALMVGDLAILPSIKFATGSAVRGTGTGTTDVSLLVISSRTVRQIAIDLNAGYTRRSGDGSGASRQAAVWTASFGGPAAGRLGWCAEIYGYPSIGIDGSDSIVALLAGPTFGLKPSIVVDAGFIAPFAGPQPRALYAGVTWNVGRLWSVPRHGG